MNESDVTPYNCNYGNNDSRIMERIKYSTLLCLRQGDKKGVIDWCMKMGLIASTYFCAKCGMPMKLIEKKNISDGYAWFCRKRGVNEHVSSRTVRTGSWFAKSRMELCEILILVHCWVYQLPLEWIRLELGCSQTTVYEWFTYCRDICIGIDSISMIGGENKTIEIDETRFNCITNSGDITKAVIAGIEKDSTRCFFKVIENRNSDSFLEVIERNILPGTTIILHCFNAYYSFENENIVEFVTRDYSFKKPDMGSRSAFQDLWQDLKDFMPLSVDKFDSYLAEYSWRKNNCISYDKMKSFIDIIKIIYPLHANDLLFCE